jgi:hypothetical protein
MDSQIAPVEQYDFLWAVLVGGFGFVILCFYIVTLLTTRQVKRHFDVNPLPDILANAEFLSSLKNMYARKIANVGLQYEEGQLLEKEAYQSLIVLLRDFGQEYSSNRANTMTLIEVMNSNAPDFFKQNLINLYSVAFDDVEHNGDVEKAVMDALGVIQAWD